MKRKSVLASSVKTNERNDDETEGQTVNRRLALKTLGIGSLAGAILAGCGQDQEPEKSVEMAPEPSPTWCTTP